MPPFLTLLFFVEMWERFSYYGMRALLVLYLTSSLGFDDPKAYAIYSLFAALGYAGPVLGGFLADTLMGFRSMVFIGGLVVAFGHAMMAFSESSQFLLYFGLGLIAIGTGLFKGNITNLLGCCYAPDDPQRDRGFTMFYVSVNLGSFIAAILCSYVASLWGWHYGFGLAGIGMIMGLILFAKFQHILGEHGLSPKPTLFATPLALGLRLPHLVVLGAILAGAGFAMMLQSAWFFSELLSYFGILMGLVMLGILARSTPLERHNLSALVVLIVFLMCFFALEMQLGSLINLFTERNIDRHIFGFTVPASVFQSLNPLSIMIFGPILSGVFAYFGPKWGMPRFAFGLLTMALSFAALYLGCLLAVEGLVNVSFLIVGLSIMGIGELCVAPLLQSYTTMLSPQKIRGFMMGMLMLALSFSNLAGLVIAKFLSVPKIDGQVVSPLVSLEVYQTGFYQIMLINLGIFAFFCLLTPWLHRIVNPSESGTSKPHATSKQPLVTRTAEVSPS